LWKVYEAMTKTELLESLEDSRQELVEMLETLPEEMLLQPVRPDGWTIKDILAHLGYWEGQTVTLLFQAQRGMAKPTTVHFGKETVDELNQRWYAASQQRTMDAIWQDWFGVRKQLIRRVNELSEKDLTDPKQYPWMKGKPLYQLILSDTVEHEDGHADQIREWLDEAGPTGGIGTGDQMLDDNPLPSNGDNGHLQ
jgi:hypothetical protein